MDAQRAAWTAARARDGAFLAQQQASWTEKYGAAAPTTPQPDLADWAQGVAAHVRPPASELLDALRQGAPLLCALTHVGLSDDLPPLVLGAAKAQLEQITPLEAVQEAEEALQAAHRARDVAALPTECFATLMGSTPDGHSVAALISGVRPWVRVEVPAAFSDMDARKLAIDLQKRIWRPTEGGDDEAGGGAPSEDAAVAKRAQQDRRRQQAATAATEGAYIQVELDERKRFFGWKPDPRNPRRTRKFKCVTLSLPTLWAATRATSLLRDRKADGITLVDTLQTQLLKYVNDAKLMHSGWVQLRGYALDPDAGIQRRTHCQAEVTLPAGGVTPLSDGIPDIPPLVLASFDGEMDAYPLPPDGQRRFPSPLRGDYTCALNVTFQRYGTDPRTHARCVSIVVPHVIPPRGAPFVLPQLPPDAPPTAVYMCRSTAELHEAFRAVLVAVDAEYVESWNGFSFDIPFLAEEYAQTFEAVESRGSESLAALARALARRSVDARKMRAPLHEAWRPLGDLLAELRRKHPERARAWANDASQEHGELAVKEAHKAADVAQKCFGAGADSLLALRVLATEGASAALQRRRRGLVPATLEQIEQAEAERRKAVAARRRKGGGAILSLLARAAAFRRDADAAAAAAAAQAVAQATTQAATQSGDADEHAASDSSSESSDDDSSDAGVAEDAPDYDAPLASLSLEHRDPALVAQCEPAAGATPTTEQAAGLAPAAEQGTDDPVISDLLRWSEGPPPKAAVGADDVDRVLHLASRGVPERIARSMRASLRNALGLPAEGLLPLGDFLRAGVLDAPLFWGRVGGVLGGGALRLLRDMPAPPPLGTPRLGAYLGRLAGVPAKVVAKRMASAGRGDNTYHYWNAVGRVNIDLMQYIKDDQKPSSNALSYAAKHWLEKKCEACKSAALPQHGLPGDAHKWCGPCAAKQWGKRDTPLEERVEARRTCAACAQGWDCAALGGGGKIELGPLEMMAAWESGDPKAMGAVIHYCFDEDSTQLLTNKGYLFLHEVEKLWGGGAPLDGPPADPTLLFGSFDEATKQLVYERPHCLVVNAAREQQMVEFTQAAYRSRWDDDNPYGISESEIAALRDDDEGRGANGKTPNFVSMLTTMDHGMYARIGKLSGVRQLLRFGRNAWHDGKQDTRQTPFDFTKVKARNLLDAPGLQFLGRTAGGVALQDRSRLIEVYTELALTTTAQQEAFLELYGFWLGDGTLHFSAGKPWEIAFKCVEAHDKEWLRARLATLALPCLCCDPPRRDEDGSFADAEPAPKRMKTGTQFRVSIRDASYVRVFFAAYGSRYTTSADYVASPEADAGPRFASCARDFAAAVRDGAGSSGAPSANSSSPDNCTRPLLPLHDPKIGKWLLPWAWQLGKEEARALLAGLRCADGSEATDANTIYTSSASFRDDIERLAIHAGYAPYSTVAYLAGSTRGTAYNGKPIVARHTCWKVNYPEDKQFSEPTLKKADGDYRVINYSGRTWCVTMPHGFVIARRATVQGGFVSRASRPLIQQNCTRDTQIPLWLTDKLKYVATWTSLSRAALTPMDAILNGGQQTRIFNLMSRFVDGEYVINVADSGWPAPFDADAAREAKRAAASAASPSHAPSSADDAAFVCYWMMHHGRYPDAVSVDGTRAIYTEPQGVGGDYMHVGGVLNELVAAGKGKKLRVVGTIAAARALPRGTQWALGERGDAVRGGGEPPPTTQYLLTLDPPGPRVAGKLFQRKEELCAALGAAVTTGGVQGGRTLHHRAATAAAPAEAETGGKKKRKREWESSSKFKRRMPDYEGATVIPPKAGFYTTPVSTLDFASLYPSIMRFFNLCHSTLLILPTAEELRLSGPPAEIAEALRTAHALELERLRAAGVVVESHNVVHNIQTGEDSKGTPIYRVETRTYHFVAHVGGVLPRLLERLLSARKAIKALMEAAEAAGDKSNYAVYNSWQNALKVICNSVYGFCGAAVDSGILSCKPIAAVVTQKGRAMIDATARYVESHFPGATILYGDTDSVMVLWPLEPDGSPIPMQKAWANAAAAAGGVTLAIRSGAVPGLGGAGDVALSQAIAASRARDAAEAARVGAGDAPRDLDVSRAAVKLENEKIYCPYLLLKKKRYAAGHWTPNGEGGFKRKDDMKGVDAVRRDRAPIVRSVSMGILDALMKASSVELALSGVRELLTAVAEDALDPSQYATSKALKGAYAGTSGNTPHLQAWLRMVKRGDSDPPPVGARMPFVVTLPRQCTKGGHDDPVKLHVRAEHPAHVRDHGVPLDARYYLEILRHPVDQLLGHAGAEAAPAIARMFADALATADARMLGLAKLQVGQVRSVTVVGDTATTGGAVGGVAGAGGAPAGRLMLAGATRKFRMEDVDVGGADAWLQPPAANAAMRNDKGKRSSRPAASARKPATPASPAYGRASNSLLQYVRQAGAATQR